MMHTNRRWNVGTLKGSEELAEHISENGCTWTLCTGFRVGHFLWLNDATSEDGAGEYAVIDEHTGLQVESITASWCKPYSVLQYAEEFINGVYWKSKWAVKPYQPFKGEPLAELARRVDSTSSGHTCHRCM